MRCASRREWDTGGTDAVCEALTFSTHVIVSLRLRIKVAHILGIEAFIRIRRINARILVRESVGAIPAMELPPPSI
jgi:hypothetical protein